MSTLLAKFSKCCYCRNDFAQNVFVWHVNHNHCGIFFFSFSCYHLEIFQFEENKSMMFLDDTKSVRKCFPGPKTLIWAHDDILESFLRFFQQPKILHKINFFWRNADFFMKKLIFLPSWQFFYESIWHLRMCPLSFEYFGTLSKTSRAKFLISFFVLKKFNFFDLHGLKNHFWAQPIRIL